MVNELIEKMGCVKLVSYIGNSSMSYEQINRDTASFRRLSCALINSHRL